MWLAAFRVLTNIAAQNGLAPLAARARERLVADGQAAGLHPSQPLAARAREGLGQHLRSLICRGYMMK